MNDVSSAAVHAAQEHWLRAIAVRELGAGVDALEKAGAALVPLVGDSRWQSRGVRALHERIRALVELTAGETTALRLRLWEAEVAPAP